MKKQSKRATKAPHQNQFGIVVSQTRGSTSLRKFAALAGVSHSQIVNWEDGSDQPPIKTLRRLYNSSSATIRQMADIMLGLYEAEIAAIRAGR